MYGKIEIPDEQSNNEEIKAIKRTISDLGKNILSVVNNPVSRFNVTDINLMTDYINSVNIWLYTTSASTSIEYVAKINEINKFTEEIMKKYEDKNIFEKNDKFTVRDELQLTCLTINTSVKNNYFSMEENYKKQLLAKINETMLWLISHQAEEDHVYNQKLVEINDLSNSIYHDLHKMKIIQQCDISNDDDDDNSIDEDNNETLDTDQHFKPINKISENINKLIDQLPDKPIRTKQIYRPPAGIFTDYPSPYSSPSPSQSSSPSQLNDQCSSSTGQSSQSKIANNNDICLKANNNDIFLKIDIDKLKPKTTIRYKVPHII